MRSRQIISVAVKPALNGDWEKLALVLAEITEEDSSIRIDADSDNGVIVLSGMSDSHLDAICALILNEYDIQLDVGEPKVIYLETIRKSAEGEGKYIRQTGGKGNYGHCKLRVQPNAPGAGYEFINEIKGGAVPKGYVKPIDQGVQGALELGILAGLPIVDVKVTLFDGSYHDVDSNEMAFKFAGSIAFKEAARKASPVVLEPVMALEVRAPEQLVAAVIRDLNARRGRIEGVERTSEFQVIKAAVPLAKMIGYVRDIRSIGHGRARHSMEFAQYEEVSRLDESEDGWAGVPANKPTVPKIGHGSARARPDAELE